MAKQPPSSSKRESRARPDTTDKGERLEVIVKVRKPNYVPGGVDVRAQISPVMFTSVVSGSGLEKLEKDPDVQSVAVSQKLRTIG